MGGSAEVAALKTLLTQLPLNDYQRLQAEELVKKCTLEELQELGLTAPARPVVPKGLDKLPDKQRLQAVQRVISSLHYNHAPGYMYNVSKDRPHCAIMNTAREVLRDALPIKCIEATFLGMLLTSNWPELERLPVGFKSKCAGQAYRHIVLAVRHVPTGQWGALGISRRHDLMYKELGTATSLADLMWIYKTCYAGWGHLLYKIRVGLPAEHDAAHAGPVCWRYCNVSSGRHSWDKCQRVLNAFADNTRVLANRFKVLGFRPPSRGNNDEPGGSRVALSGTTPEPGAARPPPASSASAAPRHASVSPMRRRGGQRPEGGDTAAPPKGAPMHSPMAARHRSPAKPRPGCASAPPRQRPGGTGQPPASGAGRALLPSSTLPARGSPASRPPLAPPTAKPQPRSSKAQPASKGDASQQREQAEGEEEEEEEEEGPALPGSAAPDGGAVEGEAEVAASGSGVAPEVEGSVGAAQAGEEEDLLASLTIDAQLFVARASGRAVGVGQGQVQREEEGAQPGGISASSSEESDEDEDDGPPL